MVQAVVLLVILNCWLGQAILSLVALEEPTDINTVYVPVNGTAKLQWSLFIGENAGRSSVNVMIKKNNSLLCQWVKAHWEVNQCDPGMNLTIIPENVLLPGPTNITATFYFRNKRRVDDGTYECRFVIDEKWDEIQILQKQLKTTEKSTGINKNRVEVGKNVADSAEVDIPFTAEDNHNQTSAVRDVGVNVVQTLIAVLLVLAFGLIIIVVRRCRIWNPVKTPANDVIHQAEEETEHCVAHYTDSSGSVEIVAPAENENEPCVSQNQATENLKSSSVAKMLVSKLTA